MIGLWLSMLHEHAIGQVEVHFGPLYIVGEDEEACIGMAFAHSNGSREVIVNRTNAEISFVNGQQIVATAHMNAYCKGFRRYLACIVELRKRAEIQYLGGVGNKLFVLRIIVDEHGSRVIFTVKTLEKVELTQHFQRHHHKFHSPRFGGKRYQKGLIEPHATMLLGSTTVVMQVNAMVVVLP